MTRREFFWLPTVLANEPKVTKKEVVELKWAHLALSRRVEALEKWARNSLASPLQRYVRPNRSNL